MSTEVVMTVVTLFWACVGIVIPVFVQYTMSTSPNKGLIQTMCVLTAFCCYLFWLCAYLSQLNPLFGPQLDSEVIRYLQIAWNNK
ncbi:V-type proton ATPase subunit e 2 isoform X2 [Octopus bimaculoides]|uniref:V-type proton ATPase subunit n=1 Tax=Octopus bimaculoides TaxID=37653 RepID=A0A0L8GLH2_OCTBM|nr:V-type proton ATPase subunit e 2 isoform X2 [Octopus bimaculoides]|eukprot:XP_014780044.1 PREDICTED: V-type proton ATPase subunit e 2-like [Octopus bimaculoides]